MDRALHTPLGFRPQGVMLAETNLGQLGQFGNSALEKERQMIEAARGIPGVTEVGAINVPPMNGGARGVPVFKIGTPELTLSNLALTTRRFAISPGYLEAAATRLLGGRDVSWHDTEHTPHVAVVNETFARTIWAKSRP